jgi:CRISPR/Cas system-associated endoribonuclease Cas2
VNKAELRAAADALEWAFNQCEMYSGELVLMARLEHLRAQAASTPEPEPVAWRALIGKPTPEGYDQWRYSSFTPHESRQEWVPLYTTQPDQSARIAELEEQNKTLRNAQKSCYECDGPTMERVRELEAQVATLLNEQYDCIQGYYDMKASTIAKLRAVLEEAERDNTLDYGLDNRIRAALKETENG